MSIFQRIGQAVKSFIGKRVTGSTTKSRINRVLKNYYSTIDVRRQSLMAVHKSSKDYEYRMKLGNKAIDQMRSVSNFTRIGKIKHLRTLTEKEIVLFENIYDVKVSDSPALKDLKTFDKMSSFKQMLLTTLKDKGVNIYDPRELYKALDGHTPEEIYEAWEANEYESEDFYKEWVEDPEDVLDKIFQTGVDKSIRGYKKHQSKLWEDMKDFF